jgi:hypothetical protein
VERECNDDRLLMIAATIAGEPHDGWTTDESRLWIEPEVLRELLVLRSIFRVHAGRPVAAPPPPD